jgi:hypothetical protein
VWRVGWRHAAVDGHATLSKIGASDELMGRAGRCGAGGKSADVVRSGAVDLVPDLVPKYMVTVGTRWYLLGLAAAPPYQRVPIVTNSHKHNQDSNSLGGTIYPQVRDLRIPEACLKSGTKSCRSEGHAEGKTPAQRLFRPNLGAQISLLLRIGRSRRIGARFGARLHSLSGD